MTIRLLRVALALLGTFSTVAAQNPLYFPPKTGTTWQTTAPSTLGFCPDRIDSLYAFLEKTNSKSFVLLKDGKIVLEKYFGTFKQDSFWYWASAGKSLTAFLVGQAQEEGLLDIDDLSSKYLGTGWTSCSPDKEALITVRHQLTMTSGLDDNLPPTPAEPDPDNCTTPPCLTYKADAGTRWAYHNAPYRLIHDVIEAASGKTIQQFTQSHVLGRTGMKGLWIDHIMYGRARDMARYGLLVQAGGIWDGDTLLHDQQYQYDMSHPSQNLNKSYGYLWWLNGQESFMLPGLQLVLPGDIFPNAPDDLFAALGKNDQKIHIVPSKGWVVVRQGNPAGFTGPGGGQVPIVFDNELWGYINALVCTPTATGEADGNPSLRVATLAEGWQITLPQTPAQVALFDAQGRLLYRSLPEANAFFVPHTAFPEGIYFLQMATGNGSITRVLVK